MDQKVIDILNEDSEIYGYISLVETPKKKIVWKVLVVNYCY